jgi:hypothetical protein
LGDTYLVGAMQALVYLRSFSGRRREVGDVPSRSDKEVISAKNQDRDRVRHVRWRYLRKTAAFGGLIRLRQLYLRSDLPCGVAGCGKCAALSPALGYVHVNSVCVHVSSHVRTLVCECVVLCVSARSGVVSRFAVMRRGPPHSARRPLPARGPLHYHLGTMCPTFVKGHGLELFAPPSPWL